MKEKLEWNGMESADQFEQILCFQMKKLIFTYNKVRQMKFTWHWHYKAN